MPRTITVRLTVEVTVSTLREAARLRLGTRNQRIVAPKGTMPDPDTMRTGVIHWGTATVKQRLTR